MGKIVSIALFVIACDGTTTTDMRFSTPERTVETLLASCGLENNTQAQNQASIAETGGVQVRDAATYEAAFADLDQPGGHAMAGYVLGMIAAASDDMRYETIEGRGYAIPREGVRIVMERDRTGAYRIVLAESVPDHIRNAIPELSGPNPGSNHRPP